MSSIVLCEPATRENFDEKAYLRANPDVRRAVENGSCASGWLHFTKFGMREGRWLSRTPDISAIRRTKLEKLGPFLRSDMSRIWKDGKVDYLTDDLRSHARIGETENVSQNVYDPAIISMIERHANGLILDCGAGNRNIYYGNVVNFEIVDYHSTDVLGIGEELPFLNDAFDAVVSVAVLEHVANPFRCASEIARVLKPGGELFCCVPFLQPYHGYPHHYFNATPQGIRRLFEDRLDVQDVTVLSSTHPVHAIHWIFGLWQSGLSGNTREDFLNMTVRDFLSPPMSLVERPFASELSIQRQLEIACATVLTAIKR